MELKDIICSDTILLETKMKTRSEAFSYFADTLFASHFIGSKQTLIHELNQKENEISTAIGYDIALPHIQSENISYPLLSFIRSRKGVYWEDEENSQVKLIFLIAVPSKLMGEHINILATLSRRLMRPDVRAQLLKMSQSEEIFDILA